MVSGVAALMAAMMALMAAPAMAQVLLDFNDDDRRDRDFRDNRNFGGLNNFGGFDLDNENELESGPVDQEFSVTNTGDYASQCVPAVQFGNTGNFNNAPSFAQFGSGGGFVVDDRNDDDNDRRRFGDFFDFFGDDDDGDNDRVFRGGNTSAGDFEPGGIEFSVSPEVAVDCANTIQQSSAASSGPYNYWR
jgi:hypothetical protein